MSKVLCIPDSHLKIEVISRGLELAKHHQADKIVMLGDYFDDWYSTYYDYKEMLDYLKDILRRNPCIVPLMGNHELSYLGYPCAGHNPEVKELLDNALRKDFRFWTTTAIDGVLYSHAGVTSSWIRQNKILTENEIRYRLGKRAGADVIDHKIDLKESYRIDWAPFAKVGVRRGGVSGVAPSPLWADLTELVSDPLPNVKQIVGHTPVPEIQCIGNCWFTDVFSNNNVSDEYLLVKNGKPEVVHYEDMVYERGK